ncbi:MAG: Bax inhibitor-1/YccA family protein [Gemmatimonadaceae bacterium]|nr:Bax inhibitor-1/YccA family protein [Gemmatimonadaceae bacterium]
MRTGAERATLVRRTYLLVLGGVALTIVGVGFTFTQPALMELVARHRLLSFFAALLPLFLAMRARTQYPANIGLTLLFSFTIGVWISPLMLYYSQVAPGVIGQAAGLTFSAFGVLTAYAWISKRDFSAWGSFFVVGLWVLIATSLLNLFFRNESAALWLSGATVVIFSGLLVFDTWRIRNVYGPDEYVDAAVAIYLDLLNMFLAILHLLGGRRD